MTSYQSEIDTCSQKHDGLKCPKFTTTKKLNYPEWFNFIDSILIACVLTWSLRHDYRIIDCYGEYSKASIKKSFSFNYSEYSKVMVLVFKYSLRASLPRSFPNPDSLNPPNGVATSVLLYLRKGFFEILTKEKVRKVKWMKEKKNEKKLEWMRTYTLTKQVPASRCSLT